MASTAGPSGSRAHAWPGRVDRRMTILDIEDLRIAWPGERNDCLAIERLALDAGERLFLHGPSGSGKSTLLSLMAGVLVARSGRAALLDTDWRSLPPGRRDSRRADHVGYLFQQFNLLPYLSAMDNLLLLCRFSARRRAAAEREAGSLLAAAQSWLVALELPRESWSRPARTLSVGQQQRVAAARALIGRPQLVIADEPTSALDESLRNAFVDLLLEACERAGSALVFVSHNERLAARFRRSLSLPELNRAATAAAAGFGS